MQESSFDPYKKNSVSSAQGLFQLLGQDWKDYQSWRVKAKSDGTAGNYPQVNYILYKIKNNIDPYTKDYNKQLEILEDDRNNRSKFPNSEYWQNKTVADSTYISNTYGERIKQNRLFPVISFQEKWNDESSNLDDLTSLFEETFEKSGTGKEHEKRRKYARAFYEHFTGTPYKKQGGTMTILDYLKNGSGIHIKKANRGKFTDYCGGKVTEECIQRGKNSSNPTTRKRANFAWVARHKFHHQDGGIMNYLNYCK